MLPLITYLIRSNNVSPLFRLKQRSGIGVSISVEKVTYKGKWVDDYMGGEGEQTYEDR